MQGFAGVLVFREDSVLLVNEPDYFTGEPRWTFPSGHIDDGEDPVTAAVRELAEESGSVIDPHELELIAVADVTQAGQVLSRSWNYTAITAASSLRPRRHDDETVTEANWFARDDAVALLTRSSYPPKIEPAVRFVSTGERVLKWTFELVDTSGSSPTFQWDPPTLLEQQ